MRPGDLGPQPLPEPIQEPLPEPFPEPFPHRAPSTSALEFQDADYVWWWVAERDARHDPGARGQRCLIFASADALRRVWDYPAGWRELSAAQLVALSWHR